MTILPPAFHLTTVETRHAVRIEITGDLLSAEALAVFGTDGKKG